MRHAMPASALAVTLALACVRKDVPQPAASAPIPMPLFDNRIFAGGVPPAGVVSTANPVAGDTSAAREGAQLFTAMNCDGCHGGGATGWVGPSLTDGRWRYGGSDAEVFLSIYYGRPKGMPSFGGMLAPNVVWKLVTYLKTQPLPKDVPTERW
jgi:cytochrome c oxidase cbb3-type subunit 3